MQHLLCDFTLLKISVFCSTVYYGFTQCTFKPTFVLCRTKPKAVSQRRTNWIGDCWKYDSSMSLQSYQRCSQEEEQWWNLRCIAITTRCRHVTTHCTFKIPNFLFFYKHCFSASFYVISCRFNIKYKLVLSLFETCGYFFCTIQPTSLWISIVFNLLETGGLF